MPFSRIPLLLALLHIAAAEQPSAPSPIAAPLRELPWGRLNFLHTTDTHGWHGGHLQEAQYGADWGDYVAFAHHLRERARSDGADLLLVDTGDRIEGNGLYDASDPKGKYTYDIFRRQHLDVVTVGNHELYLRESSENERRHTVPDHADSYIASNLDIYDPESGDFGPLAPRYRILTTPNQGVRILCFGFLFNFRGNANNTVVRPVQETIKEEWFQHALRERDVDLILVAGHVPVRESEEYDLIYKAIRAVRWDTPIVFFGGHTHIRDYRRWEGKAQGIESGRYMETIGFLSIDGVSGKSKGGRAVDAEAARGVKYGRRYIDNNLFSLHHHSGRNESDFQTELGANVSKAIRQARKSLGLDHAFGCAPRTYWLNRAPYPSDDSLLTWLDTEVFPQTFGRSTEAPSIVITNSGAMRFDIFEGPFTVDSTFLVSPFTSGFRVLKDIPYAAATQVLPLLNNQGPIPVHHLPALARPDGGRRDMPDLAAPFVPQSKRSRARVDRPTGSGAAPPGAQVPLTSADRSVPGYTTVDDMGSDGDDTVHQAIRFYDVPNCVGASVNFDPTAPDEKAPERVDIIYNEFAENWILLALRFLGVERDGSDSEPTLEGKSMTTVIGDWVGENWACKE